MRKKPASAALETDSFNPAALPLTIWPENVGQFEPVYGWLQRAADANYAFSTESFLASLGLNGLDWDFDEQLALARELPLREFERLEQHAPKRIGEAFEICGHDIPSRFFNKTVQRICPACLDEARHIRVWFDLVPIAACPFHDLELIEGLANDPINWRNPEVGVTRNGIKLTPEHARPRPSSKLDNFILNSLSDPGCEYPAHLVGESLGEIIQAATSLGRLHHADRPMPPSHAARCTLAQSGFPALVEGMEEIAAYLANSAWIGPEFKEDRYTSLVNQAPSILRTISSKNLQKLVRESFGLARVRSGAATPYGKLARFDGEEGLCTLKCAARALGLRPEHMKRILKALSLKTEQCPRTRTHRIHEKHIGAVEEFIDESLCVEDAAKRLGCSLEDVRELVRRKTLPVAFSRSGIRHFTEGSIQSLIDNALETMCPRVAVEAVPLREYATNSKLSLAEAYAQLIKGKTVSIVGYDADLPFFCGVTVAKLYRQRTRPKAQRRDPMSLTRVASRLGTDLGGLKLLIDLALLQKIADGAGHVRICEKSLKLFERTYAKAAEYAPLLGCPPTTALKHLRKAGIKTSQRFRREQSQVCEAFRGQASDWARITFRRHERSIDWPRRCYQRWLG